MPKKPLIDQLHHEDSWRLFRILAEFVEGFETLSELQVPLVSVFGSARFGEGHPAYEAGYRLGRALGLSTLRLLHGKGTGALRQAIREALRRDKRVESFADAPPGEGGHGVTVVALRP